MLGPQSFEPVHIFSVWRECPFSDSRGSLQTQHVVDTLHKSNNNRLPGHQVPKPV